MCLHACLELKTHSPCYPPTIDAASCTQCSFYFKLRALHATMPVHATTQCLCEVMTTHTECIYVHACTHTHMCAYTWLFTSFLHTRHISNIIDMWQSRAKIVRTSYFLIGAPFASTGTPFASQPLLDRSYTHLRPETIRLKARAGKKVSAV